MAAGKMVNSAVSGATPMSRGQCRASPDFAVTSRASPGLTLRHTR